MITIAVVKITKTNTHKDNSFITGQDDDQYTKSLLWGAICVKIECVQ